MTYTKKQFLEDVAKEAKALRKHATAEELNRLDFKTFYPNRSTQCIYGQMVGSCYSDRAVELIEKCAPVFVHCNSGFKQIVTVPEYDCSHWSAIEHYVRMEDAKNKNLISYLKGEKNDLKL